MVNYGLQMTLQRKFKCAIIDAGKVRFEISPACSILLWLVAKRLPGLQF